MTRLIRNARSLLHELRSPYELERIERPVLLVWGTRDRLIPPKSARLVLDAVPGSRLELIDGAGHCAQIEEPERLAELIAAFAGRATAVAAASP